MNKQNMIIQNVNVRNLNELEGAKKEIIINIEKGGNRQTLYAYYNQIKINHYDKKPSHIAILWACHSLDFTYREKRLIESALRNVTNGRLTRIFYQSNINEFADYYYKKLDNYKRDILPPLQFWQIRILSIVDFVYYQSILEKYEYYNEQFKKYIMQGGI